MKKFENLGRSLSKDEQRKISGGKVSVICTCNNCNMETVVCSADSFGGTFNCMTGAHNYCTSIGCPNTSCDIAGEV